MCLMDCIRQCLRGTEEQRVKDVHKHKLTHRYTHKDTSYLIILKVSRSLILMVRATFQETWIMGTIDLTFFTSFHS